MAKKEVVQNVKKYSIYSIIWWISLIPAIVTFVLSLRGENEALQKLFKLFVSFSVIFSVLAIIGFIGKMVYWVKIFSSTTQLRTKNKNTLVSLMVLDIFIPFLPFYIYRKKVDKFSK